MNRTALPRLLAIMGSGETAPTMARVHRELFRRLGPSPTPAALLDTPYGFQENADEITARALEYFRVNVGQAMELASFRSSDVDDPLVRASAVARVREANYLFSGPGSPTYALRQWQGTEIPEIVCDKLERCGIVVFASAAALTLGAWTVPVYEVYKVGADPYWLDGLDVLGRFGIRAAVIPHYDNAEGGTHDTRFAYLGERRLEMLERELPDDAFILGVDSHTALVLDFEAGTAEVLGLGGATVRARGQSKVVAAGSTVPIASLANAGVGAVASNPVERLPAPSTATPLLDEVRDHEERFEEAARDGRGDDALRAVLELDDALVAWSRDTTGTDEIDRARSVLRALIVRLGEGAGQRAGQPDVRVAPLVELLLELRGRARDDRDYQLADRIRDALLAAGVEVHDSPEATTWEVRAQATDGTRR
jgi:hypothetical protein